ncbi:MAG: acyl-CoA thioester hydrolase/BAAT C-terminal domain-containing protein [Flavobacteriales bacterium]|nr:acyl-CoA thioester hydrolase/BAAT C-terminal domain-containing protein [Flavobacteriales bacterium]
MKVNYLEIDGCNGRKISIDYRFKVTQKSLIPIIYVHGFKGFKDWGASNLVADYFANQGFLFLKFNFSHNGVTPKNPLDFVDLEAFGMNNYLIELKELGIVIDWLEASELNIQFSKLAVIGHSRGGGIALLRSAQDKRIKNTITWASVCDFEARFPVDVSEWKETGVQHILNGRTMQMMPLYFQFYKTFIDNKEILNIPFQFQNIEQNVMIIHGTDDQVVPFSDAKFIESRITKSTLVLIKNTGHTFGVKHPFKINHLPKTMVKVIDESIKFLNA